MKLKQLIEELEKLPQNRVVRFGFARPHSWRGYYNLLAFEPEENVTVTQMLESAKSALGTTYVGYKGGDFKMDEDTSVVIDYEGCYEDRALELFLKNIDLP